MTSPANVSSSPSFSADTAADWFRVHGKRFGVLAAAAVVIGGGFWFYRYNKAETEIRAEQQYYQAEQSLVAGNLPLAASDLQKVITRFDGTRAAEQARLGLAQALYGQGKHADGMKALEPVKRSGPFGAAAEALTAAGYEEMAKPADAAAHYRAAAEASALVTDKSNYLAEAAREYAAAGSRDSAVAIWTRLSEDLRSSSAAEARVRLGELVARPASR